MCTSVKLMAICLRSRSRGLRMLTGLYHIWPKVTGYVGDLLFYSKKYVVVLVVGQCDTITAGKIAFYDPNRTFATFALSLEPG